MFLVAAAPYVSAETGVSPELSPAPVEDSESPASPVAFARSSTALAAGPDCETKPALPYVPGLRGDGPSLRLVDYTGRTIRTDTALTLMGRPELAEEWRTQKRTRLIGAIALWSAAGTAYVASAGLTAVDETASIATFAAVPILAATGTVVFVVNPKKQLGGWVSRDEAEDWIATLEPRVHTAADVKKAEELFAKERLYIDYDGTLVDAERNPIKMNKLMRLVDDPETYTAWKARRRTDNIIWITTTAVGGGATLAGATVTMVGLIYMFASGYTNSLVAIGLGAVGLGVAGVGIGMVGMFTAKDMHDDPTYYYDEATLRGVLDTNDADLRKRLGLPTSTGQLEIMPIVGPGVLGLAGTF
jgi:hypothetical protein